MRSSGRNTGGQRGGKQGGPKGRQQARQQRSGRPRPEERRYDQSGAGGRGDQPAGRPGGSRPGAKGPGKGAAKAAKNVTKGAGRPPAKSAEKGGRPAARGADKAAGRPAAGRPAAGGGEKGGNRNVTKYVTRSGAPKSRSRKPSAPARPREYEAQIEERNRARHTRPAAKLPKTFGEQEGERLQKVLARAGMGSRRSCEELIDRARVEVNGKIVREQGLRVDPAKDEIKVDGLTIATQSYLFFALNKPAGVVASMEDPEGRQCLGDYVQNRETRLFHVGRLDTETEGVILLTNHGELAHRLTHPRYGVTKTYLAAIEGPLPRDLGKRLKEGVRLDDGYARADHFKVVENTGKNYLVEVSLHEGRKHIVRRMLAEAGFPVDKLVRTRFGPIALGDQKSGWLRRLTNTEVGMLMKEVGL
ncbi:pseudouridine synthase [Streptomyces cacaoi]|uniref:Pseudouridine synthase n=3 Tax=Streptomyces cacaoi TaxID=1898 RepID=A0A4Y3R8E7_STRCI|nr:pseudouridine synthase [Streptomyces cacaoi]GEB52997.1 hypothetical protein SCA03_55480 [Streptomyces cacaoi]